MSAHFAQVMKPGVEARRGGKALRQGNMCKSGKNRTTNKSAEEEQKSGSAIDMNR